jgi:hypothetical protein
MVANDQFRTFAIGLVGATIANVGLFTLSDADETRDDGRRQSLKATSESLSGRQPIAKAPRSDIEAIAFNSTPIQVDTRDRNGGRK